MGQALYRKYRSKKLSEIVGQEHITNALEQALTSGRISHAYLFTGPRGIGKTSIARILAYEVNNVPYDELATHLDIIEIDAASNRRIDEVRDLREKVHIAPTSAKYKVYIIDEVHMLTREAFNALLKTLEEPPAHVIFILATTEAHKLPETIISRTQHFSFKPIEQNKVISHLKSIAKEEGITITDDALKLIAQHGGGSFRDSISLLDQVRNSSEKVTLENVQTMLGIAPNEVVASLLSALESSDAKKLITLLQDLRSQGIESVILAKQLASHIRSTLLDGSNNNPTQSLQLLEKLIEIPTSADPFASLEVSLLNVIFSSQASKTTPVSKSPVTNQPKPKKPTTSAAEKVTKPTPPPEPLAEVQQPVVTKEAVIDSVLPVEKQLLGSAIDAAIWPEVLNDIKKTYNTLYGLLRMAQPEFTDNAITLHLKFAFHQKRLNEPKSKTIIAEAVKKISGINPEITCVVEEPTTDKSTSSAAQTQESESNANPLGTISNIFGGAELLES